MYYQADMFQFKRCMHCHMHKVNPLQYPPIILSTCLLCLLCEIEGCKGGAAHDARHVGIMALCNHLQLGLFGGARLLLLLVMLLRLLLLLWCCYSCLLNTRHICARRGRLCSSISANQHHQWFATPTLNILLRSCCLFGSTVAFSLSFFCVHKRTIVNRAHGAAPTTSNRACTRQIPPIYAVLCCCALRQKRCKTTTAASLCFSAVFGCCCLVMSFTFVCGVLYDT